MVPWFSVCVRAFLMINFAKVYNDSVERVSFKPIRLQFSSVGWGGMEFHDSCDKTGNIKQSGWEHMRLISSYLTDMNFALGCVRFNIPQKRCGSMSNMVANTGTKVPHRILQSHTVSRALAVALVHALVSPEFPCLFFPICLSSSPLVLLDTVRVCIEVLLAFQPRAESTSTFYAKHVLSDTWTEGAKERNGQPIRILYSFWIRK